MDMEQQTKDVNPNEIKLIQLNAPSQWVVPLRMEFNVKDKKKVKCDMVQAYDSVSILIFNRSRNVFVFVKQFRPPVFYQSNKSTTDDFKMDVSMAKPEDGITLELCAGAYDKEGSKPVEIAKMEVIEECGYDVPIENFELISSFRNCLNYTGECEHLFYTEVTDEMKVSEGGGNISEGEFIQVVEMSIPEAKDYITQKDIKSEAGMLFGITWFLLNKIY